MNTAQRVFYSKASHLTIQINPGVQQVQNGMVAPDRAGQKFASFGPISDGYGQLITSDPEVIAHLEQHPDVFGPEEYTKRTTPKDQQIEDLTRRLEQSNRLLERLQAEGKLPSPALGKEAVSPPIKPPMAQPVQR